MTALRLRALLAATLATAGIPAVAQFPPVAPDTAVEFYHRGFDHYFVTRDPSEIDALDSGRTVGWTRTGRGFKVFPVAPGNPAANPVCRFYIPPEHGDSHFFSASLAECASVLGKIGVEPDYSGYVYESPSAFYAALPDTASGACPAGFVPVFRLWNRRADSNHRYTADPGIKAAMQAKGYLAEGFGPNAASLCSTAAVPVDALTRASGTSPFAPGCDGVVSAGVAYVSSEVEPYVAVNPADPNNVIAVWQQDRWSNGGARGVAGAYSLDGGGTWTRIAVPFSRCSGGNAGNGGDWERATDPWVTFAPDGTAHWMALAFNNVRNGDNAMLSARSADGGRTWGAPATLRRDGAASFNDKNSITADPTDARYVYAVWDRLTGNDAPTWFARTADGGLAWEPAREIYVPGANRQTINNQIVVLPDGTLVLHFTELATTGSPNPALRIMRSTDRGATWSAPITIAAFQTVGTVDPDSGIGVRDGSILGSIAAGRNGVLAVAWQDARYGGGHDGIAFARSTDGGLTWTDPVRVNGDASVPAFLPTVAIRDDGTTGVTYYDFRANTPDPGTLPTLYWLATSGDGTTWAERTLAGPLDYATAPLAGGRLFLGDYAALVPTGTSFVALFGVTTGDSANRSDISAGLVRAGAVPAARNVSPVRAAGATSGATAATSERADANARRVLAQRLPDGILPGRTRAE
ncbi:MAG: sialidase family protein [Burkholderiales bacterium]